MSIISSFNSYLKRNGDDSGMSGDLKMNKKRILSLGDSTILSDAANIKSVDSLASVNQVNLMPAMTSPSEPIPFQVYGDPNGSEMWLMFDKNSSTSWTCPSSARVTVNVVLGDVKPFDCLFISCDKVLSDFVFHIVSGISDIVIVTADFIEPGGHYVRLTATERLQNARIEFDCSSNTAISEISLLRKSINVNGDCVVHVSSDSGPYTATNIQYVQNIVRPLSTVVSGTFVNPPMRSASQDGYVTQASSEIPGYESFMPFNFDFSSMWLCDTLIGSLQITLPAPKKPRRLQLLGRIDDVSQFTSWSVEASNDTIVWDLVCQGSGRTPSMLETYELQIANSYVHFRFVGVGRSGSSVSGLTTFNLAMDEVSFNGNRITGVSTPVNPDDAVPKSYVDGQAPGGALRLSGGIMTGPIEMSGASHIVQSLPSPLVTSLGRVMETFASISSISSVATLPLGTTYAYFNLYGDMQLSSQQPLLLAPIDFGIDIQNPKGFTLLQNSLVQCPVGFSKLFGFAVVGTNTVVTQNVEVSVVVSNIDQVFSTDASIISVGSGMLCIPFVFYVPTGPNPIRIYVSAGVGAQPYVCNVYKLWFALETQSGGSSGVALRDGSLGTVTYVSRQLDTLPQISARLLVLNDSHFQTNVIAVDDIDRTFSLLVACKILHVMVRAVMSAQQPSIDIDFQIFAVGQSIPLIKKIKTCMIIGSHGHSQLSISEYVNVEAYPPSTRYCLAIRASKDVSIVSGNAVINVLN
jgi:hypothetical protein